MAEGVNEVASSGFGAGADAYERGRPSYPTDLVSWAADHLALGPGRRVADVAAGTGKFTRLLTAAGAQVVAVEPVAAMRAKLASAGAGIEVVDGTAEDLPLDDRSVDAITVAQAFHWFDPAAALASFARVLRPGGGVVLAFNERDAREPWVAELSRLIRWDERGRWRVPYTMEVDWAPVIAEHGPAFGPVIRYDTSFRQPMDVETLVARVLSTSYLARMPEADRAELADQVRALAEPLGDEFDLPYVSVAYGFHRA